MAEYVNTDEYYLDDDSFDGNDDQIDGLKERLRAYREVVERFRPGLTYDGMQMYVADLLALADERMPREQVS